MKQLSPTALTASYATALLIIALLSIASHLVLEHVLSTNEGAASVVNISGRQRMLSQRIAGLAAQIRLGDATAHDELLAAVTTFETANDRLVQDYRSETLSDEGAQQLHALYFDGETGLDARTRRFAAKARRFAALPPDDPAAPGLLADLFAEARTPLLKDLDKVVAIHQRESEYRIAELQRLQWAILTIVLVTLMVEALAIFRPMTHRILVYTQEIMRLATTDTLTGAANRRSFMDRAAAEFERAKRQERPLSLLMIDADKFKTVNDTYGHAGGDEVLKALSEALRSGLREQDVLGRLGGEEFAILAPGASLADAVRLAERLRQAVAALTVAYGEHQLKFTISIGVAEIQAGMPAVEHVLVEADSRLYKAKAAGRNRVIAEAAA